MAAKVKDQGTFDKGMIRVLVYGTLKKFHANHVLLEEGGAKFIGYDCVTGPYNMWDLGGLPAITDSTTGNRKMRGELWAIDPETLAALDLLEGHPFLYERRKIWTDVFKRRAWVYVLKSNKFLTEDTDEAPNGLWHPSETESKFWAQYTRATA